MRRERYVTTADIGERTATWLGAVRSSAPVRHGLTFSPERAMLLVVDLVNYFAHPGGRAFLPAVSCACGHTPECHVFVPCQ
jgi:hypothetical protein